MIGLPEKENFILILDNTTMSLVNSVCGQFALFDNGCIELFYIYQGVLFTLGAIEREIFQYCIRAQLNSGFIFANRTEQPFHFTCTHAI